MTIRTINLIKDLTEYLTGYSSSTMILLLFLAFTTQAQIGTLKTEYQLVYHQTFEAPQALDGFDMTDKSAWKINHLDDNKTLELFGQSEYRARVRSPFNIALIKDLLVGDFDLEVNLAQSGREYGHRDLCIFWGFQNPSNFYYVHIASVTDDHANNVFIVNDAPRTKISTKTTEGTDWGATNSWHKVRIERRIAEGSIKVFFDNMDEPIMEASDQHFEKGQLGFGSFDDTGQFDNVKVWAPEVSNIHDSVFKKSH